MDAYLITIFLLLFSMPFIYFIGSSQARKIWRMYQKTLSYNRELFDSWFILNVRYEEEKKRADALQSWINNIPVADIGCSDSGDWWRHGGEPPDWTPPDWTPPDWTPPDWTPPDWTPPEN